MRVSKKKEHSVFCGNSLQSAGFPDAWHLFQYIHYATSAEADSTVIKKSYKQKERHNYVKSK